MAFIGHVDEISRRSVSGWAMDSDHPEQSINLDIFVDDQKIATICADQMRKGLRESLNKRVKPELHAEITCRYSFEFVFPSALSVFSESRVEVRFSASSELLARGAKTLPRPQRGAAPLVPLLVTGAGRSGTTMLMQRLASHPQIVVADRYPFEIKLMAYYTAAFRVLVANADREKSSDPATLFGPSERYSIGFNPYNRPGFYTIAKDSQRLQHFFEETVPAATADMFRSLLASYYDILRASQQKNRAVYFAEKGDLHEDARQGPRLFFGTIREIVLVRDVRDVLCSSKSFWKIDTRDALLKLTAAAQRLERIHAAMNEQMILIRYEDLITQPGETMDRLYRFLSLERDIAVSTADEARLFDIHATSGNPAASIGRWRTHLSADEIAICASRFQSFFSRFGYDPG